jgi:hypothetical protein
MVPGKKCGQKVWGTGEYWCIAKGENIFLVGAMWLYGFRTYLYLDPF